MERDADSAVSYQGCRGKEREMERDADADSAISYQGCRGKERDMERDADGALFRIRVCSSAALVHYPVSV